MSGLQLAPATPADARELLHIYAPYVERTAITFECETPTEQEFAGRMAAVGAFYPWLVARLDGATMGYAYASRHQERAAYRWNAELSVYVDQGARGEGVGTALYRAALRLLAAQGVRNAYGVVTLPNERSLRLHRAFGFREVGVFRRTGFKLGRWHDVVHLEKSLGDAASPPTEPRRVHALDPALVDRILQRRDSL